MVAAPTMEAIEVIVVDQFEPFRERDFLGKDEVPNFLYSLDRSLCSLCEVFEREAGAMNPRQAFFTGKKFDRSWSVRSVKWSRQDCEPLSNGGLFECQP
jgi:hypothetical protein